MTSQCDWEIRVKRENKKEKNTHLHKLTACMDPPIHLLDLTSRSTPSTISSNFNFQIQSIDTTDSKVSSTMAKLRVSEPQQFSESY